MTSPCRFSARGHRAVKGAWRRPARRRRGQRAQLSKRILDHAAIECAEPNGDDAERVFAHHAGSIDLIVTDVIMPGCGGPELVSRLQVQAPALRVLYMSGYTDQSAAQKAGIDRGLPFVQKPFTAEELVRQVRQALERSCPEEPVSTE